MARTLPLPRLPGKRGGEKTLRTRQVLNEDTKRPRMSPDIRGLSVFGRRWKILLLRQLLDRRRLQCLHGRIFLQLILRKPEFPPWRRRQIIALHQHRSRLIHRDHVLDPAREFDGIPDLHFALLRKNGSKESEALL